MTAGGGLVLVGLRRSGKSSVGRVLAAELGRPFLDLDEEVARLAGRSPGVLLREEGETAFRAWELRALSHVSPGEGLVLAAGGGTPLDPEAARLMTSLGRVVYLHVPLEELAARAAADPAPEQRPLLGGAATPEEEVRRLYRDRDALFRRLAAEVVDASGGIQQTAGRCRRVLKAL